MVYTYDGILVSLKKEGNYDHATILKNLENIMLSEISLSKKNKRYIIPLI